MAGRKEDPVWRCFTKSKILTGSRKTPVATCKGCAKEISQITARAKTHADSCGALRRNGMWSVAGPRITDSLEVQAKSPVEHAVAQWIFANNVSFRYFTITNTLLLRPFPLHRTVENEHFKKMIDVLRPGCKVPCARTISGRLLDEVEAEQMQRLGHHLKSEMVSMSMDGWTDPNGNAVVGLCLEEHLVEVACDAHAHTGEHLATVALECV